LFAAAVHAALTIPPAVARAAPAEGASPPLARLPRKPGPHVARIRALGDNTWLHLGKPRPDPKWGSARGRSWTAKMAFAPDLGGAFLFGEGVHGWWNRKTGRYMDDLWFYDLNAHRWVCAYPGAHVHRLDLRLNAHGFEVTKTGMPLPVAQMAHGYEATAYDTDRKRFLFMPCPGGSWQVLRERRTRWLKQPHGSKLDPSSPWAYSAKAGRWERRAVRGQSPQSGFGHVLVYLPVQQRTFFWGSGHEVWFYAARTNRWTKVSPKGPPPPFGIDPTACLDTRRQRIYLGGGSYPVAKGPNALWVYDLKTDTWIDPRPKGRPCRGSNSYATNYATMTYEAAADVVLLNRHGGATGERGLYVYHPGANTWTAEPKPFPKGLTWQCVNAFYDPHLNVHVFHSAGDSRADGTIWVYRHRRTGK
jgi:hypothetical protein